MIKTLPSAEQVTAFLKDHPWIKSVPSLMRRFNYSYEYDKNHRLFFESTLKKSTFSFREKIRKKRPGFGFRDDKRDSDRKSSLTAIEVQGHDEEGNFIARKMPSLTSQSVKEEPYFSIHRRQDPLLKVGDQLIVRLLKAGRVEIVRKLGKSSKVVVGVARIDADFIRVTPCNRRDKRDLRLLPDPKAPIQEGDIVVVEVSDGMVPTVTKVLGNQNDPTVLPLIALYTHGIETEFSSVHLEQAQNDRLPSLEDRQDLRNVNFMTIDGEDAKDFDDAVWAEPDGNGQGWHIIVAIADVSWYVPFQSDLDNEAKRRGNSVYLPGMVVPMLPESLSNGACSLKPHEDRACLAAHLWIDDNGDLLKYSFEKALIHSKQRFTYTQVQDIFDNVENNPHPLKQDIVHLYGAFRSLLKARLKRGALDLEMTEYRIALNEQGDVENVFSKSRLDSHRLIEEMMICANVAAAKFLQAYHTLCMYRIHEPPDMAKVSAMLDFAQQRLKLNNISKKPTFKPQDFKKLLQEVDKTPYQDTVSELVLRCQSQARYNPDNQGHFGLNLQDYAHFTSPIRRYADLLVHRAITAVLDKQPFGYDKQSFFQIGNEISLCERRAVMAERDTFERYICRYLKKNDEQIFQARISSILKFGMFVVLSCFGATAMVPIELVKGRFLKYNEKKQCLSGKDHSYQLGDYLKIKIVDIDSISGTIKAAMV